MWAAVQCSARINTNPEAFSNRTTFRELKGRGMLVWWGPYHSSNNECHYATNCSKRQAVFGLKVVWKTLDLTVARDFDGKSFADLTWIAIGIRNSGARRT